MTELIQKKGSKWDKLTIQDGVIVHKWDLGKENGTKQTPVENIDTSFGFVEQRGESRAMYFTLAVILFLIFLISPTDSLLGNVGGWITLALGCVFVFAGIFRKRNRYMDMIYTKEGGLFAVIRRDWVDGFSRDGFLQTLKDAAGTETAQPENKPGVDNPDQSARNFGRS